ncbi:uncharacterized protein [Chelonus insularis]|uniref:uncharacterized protein isoform X2 n=1 Tax=Chelonus insularis TaxID=460826 RepID=UPI00158C81F4|nr:uncharacterized protein LOC118066632 isoform X2 [Chelonus insularis]
MLTLQASDLLKHHEQQNELKSHHHNNDVNTDNLHGSEAMHDLQNCIDNNLNNNTKLPSYQAFNLEDPSRFTGDTSDIHHGPEFICIEDDNEDEDEEDYDDEEGEEEMNDEDEEDIAESENVITQMGGWTNGMPMNKVIHETVTGHVLPSLDSSNFGEVNIKKSKNVRVGNTTLYKGPVTIKQFVYTNSNPTQENSVNTINERISDVNPNDVPIVKDDNKTPIFPIHREYNKVREWLWTWRCAAILSVMALIFISTVVVVSVSFSQRPPYSPLPPALDPDDILYDGVRFIQRTEWGAQPPEDVWRWTSLHWSWMGYYWCSFIWFQFQEYWN